MEHLTLFQLNKIVQKALDVHLEPTYWVIAEIGDFRVQSNGHCYLELVEKEGNNIIAKSRATIWSYTYRNLSLWFEKMTGQSLKQGLKILCNVSIQFHELYGFSFNIKDIDANFTLGERARKRQEVIEKLKEEGVFEMNTLLPVPRLIKRIAVISSPSAAGYEDFLESLTGNRFGYQYHVTLYKAAMQGSNAPIAITDALLAINDSKNDYDAVVIIRGGGSQLDLDCFDDYELCLHACQYPSPILSGIGHNRDESVLDMVAHLALKTPTAVAEWIINLTLEYESLLLTYFERISKSALLVLRDSESKIDRLTDRLKNRISSILVHENYLIENSKNKLFHASKYIMNDHYYTLKGHENTLQLLDPQKVLKRGYTLTSINGNFIKPGMIKIGDQIVTRTDKITIESKIEEINE
jgi:exodeoxyribonuclease VII large subunit